MLEQFKERYLRNSRKLTDMIPIAAVLSFLAVIAGQLVSLLIMRPFGYSIDATFEDTSQSRALYMAAQYFTFIGIWITIGLCIAIPPANRRMIKDILPNRRGNGPIGIGLGILLGFSINGVCILLSLLLGDIGMSFNEFNLGYLLLLYFTILVQSGAEEIVDRLFLYEKLRRRYKSPWVAIIVNALVFMAMHLANPGITIISCAQIALIGVIFSLFVYYFDSLWAAIFFHTTWNYTQNIIFGCPNSGIVSAYSIFKLDAASTGAFFDATFGVEGSVGAVVFLSALLVAVLVYAKKMNPERQDLWADLDVPKPTEPPTSTGPEDPAELDHDEPPARHMGTHTV